jgi:hypothetical protein
LNVSASQPFIKPELLDGCVIFICFQELAGLGPEFFEVRSNAETAEQFERIYLLPFEWMDVTESDLRIAFTTGDSPKSFAIGLGVNLKLRPSIPD